MTFLGFGGNRVTVEIVGDAGALRREVSGSQRLTEDFSKNATRDLQLLKRAAVGVATGIAAIGGVVTGIAVKGGVERLMGLERAHRQLTQLGVSTGDQKRLLDSLNDTLLGTPFALDKGAASLAGFVASGRDLADVPRLVQQVTDAAAFGNTTLEEMDFIWQRIQTTGRVTNRELRMLAERNIPVYQQLAAALGVTGQEVFDMARTGRISADMFFDAWDRAAEGTIAGSVRIAGAAKAMGETTEGAWANMRTAMSRFGATILEDIFPLAKDIFTNIGEGFDRMADVWKRRVGDITDTKGFASLEEFIARIPEHMENAADTVFDLWQKTEGFRDVAMTVFRGFAELLTNKVVLAIGAVSVALAALYAHPVIAGLGLVAFAIGKISEGAAAAERNVNFLTSGLEDMSQVRAEQALEKWLTPRNIGLLNDMGIEVGELARLLREGKAGTEEWDALMGPFIDRYGHWTQEIALGRRETLELVDALGAAAENQTAMRETTDDLSASGDGLNRALRDQADAISFFREEQYKSIPAITGVTGAIGDHTDAVEDDTEAVLDHISALEDQRDKINELSNPYARLKTAQEKLEEARKEWDLAKQSGDLDRVTGAAWKVDEAYNAVLLAEAEILRQGPRTRAEWERQQIALGKPRDVVRQIADNLDRIGAFKPQTFRFTATLDISRALAELARLRRAGSQAFPSRLPGGIGLQHGGVVRGASGGRTIDAGEAGSDEGVIPFNQEGISILAKALKEALKDLIDGRPRSGAGPTVVQLVLPGGRVIAEAILEHEAALA